MQRLPLWDTHLLPVFLKEHRYIPFTWGRNDCCLFAADAVEAITGVDIATSFRGHYRTELGAFKLIRKLTGGSSVNDAAALCAQQHDLTEYQFPLCAQRGDLVTVTNADRLLAGVVHTDGRHVVTVGESGLLYLPITSVQRAWSV